MHNAIELINKRISVRTYSAPLEKERKDALIRLIESDKGNPFGANVRITLLEGEFTPHLGTYGFIRGAKDFLAGCVKKGGYDLEGLGFEFEKAVLYATSLGLGTCWVGGLFTRGAFSDALKPQDEYLPAISPVGYAAAKPSLVERAVAAGARGRTRKNFSELFFDGQWGRPVEAKGALAACLEAVRLAPSASNKQPWRAVRTESGIHFYMRPDKAYAGNTLLGYSIQRIDMGIAASHFFLAAKELRLGGEIALEDPHILSENELKAGVAYSFSWS